MEALPILVILKVVFLKQSSMLIMFIAVFLSTIGTFFCFIFFIYITKPLIGYLYLLIAFFKSIIIDPMTIEQPFPGYINYPLTILFPQNGLNQVLKMALVFEGNKGLNFSNINEDLLRNTPLYHILAMLLSVVMFGLLIVWVWPIS